MATKVFMEALSPTMEEGRLVKWLKQVGDTVVEGEPLLELETDKVAMEVIAPVSGVLAEIVVTEGTDADKGAVLGRINKDARAAVPGAKASATPSQAARAGAVSIATPKLQRSIATFDPGLRLSPSVRRLLIETGLDPASIRGTGKGGRITAADVEREAARPRTAARSTMQAPLTMPADSEVLARARHAQPVTLAGGASRSSPLIFSHFRASLPRDATLRHVTQPPVEAAVTDRQALVVNAHQVQNRRV